MRLMRGKLAMPRDIRVHGTSDFPRYMWNLDLKNLHVNKKSSQCDTPNSITCVLLSTHAMSQPCISIKTKCANAIIPCGVLVGTWSSGTVASGSVLLVVPTPACCGSSALSTSPSITATAIGEFLQQRPYYHILPNGQCALQQYGKANVPQHCPSANGTPTSQLRVCTHRLQ